MRRYRIPTHLTVEPSLVRAELGPLPIDLTFRQTTILACAAGLAYWLWQGSGLAPWLVIGLVCLTLALALTTAFVTVAGHAAGLWLHDALRYLSRPRRLVWRAEDGPPIDREARVIVGPSLTVTWTPPGRAADAAD